MKLLLLLLFLIFSNQALTSELHETIYAINHDKVREILKNNKSIINEKKEGLAPLHVVAKEGLRTMATLLLSYNPQINIRDEEGNTPLHFVLHHHQNHLVELFLIYGAKMNIKNHQGDTPLHIAAEKGFYTIIENYTEKDMINIQNKQGNTLAHLAVIKKDYRTTESLTNKAAKMNIKNQEGNTALHLAVMDDSTSLELIQLLLENMTKADINIKNQEGNSPVHIAFHNKRLSIAKMLIQYGAFKYEKDSKGNFPIEYTATDYGKPHSDAEITLLNNKCEQKFL